MARYGNANASTLIKAAQSAYNAQQTLNDQIQAFTYQLSARTADDLNAYKTYLNGRMDAVKANDPSKYLSLQQTLNSAQRDFRSAEIQRASIGVIEGNLNPQDKVNKISSLWQDAVSNGDFDQAQSLQLQYDNAERALLNAGGAGSAGHGGGGSAAATAQAEDIINSYDAQLQNAADIFRAKGNIQIQGPDGPQSLLAGAASYLTAKAQALQQLGSSGELSSSTSHSYLKAAQDIINGENSTEGVGSVGTGSNGLTIGGRKFTLPELNQYATYAQLGQHPYSITQDNQGNYTLKNNNLVGTKIYQTVNGPVIGNVYSEQAADVKALQKLTTRLDQLGVKYRGVNTQNGKVTGFSNGSSIEIYDNRAGRWRSVIVDQNGNANEVTGTDANGLVTNIDRFNLSNGTFETVSPQEKSADLAVANAQQTNPGTVGLFGQQDLTPPKSAQVASFNNQELAAPSASKVPIGGDQNEINNILQANTISGQSAQDLFANGKIPFALGSPLGNYADIIANLQSKADAYKAQQEALAQQQAAAMAAALARQQLPQQTIAGTSLQRAIPFQNIQRAAPVQVVQPAAPAQTFQNTISGTSLQGGGGVKGIPL